MNSYEMKEKLNFSKQGVTEIVEWFKNKYSYIEIVDIQDKKYTREYDIDFLILDFRNIDNIDNKKIEVKTDTYYHTGNYFFETISNKNKNTQGCFLYTKADLIFYYFMEQKELHILPTKETRDWFIKNIDRFQTKITSTKGDNGILYTSEGKVVPRKIVKEEVPKVNIISLKDL